MGRGRFVTWVTTYTVAPGEVVGRQPFRILKFDPSVASTMPQWPPPSGLQLTPGDEVTPLDIE